MRFLDSEKLQWHRTTFANRYIFFLIFLSFMLLWPVEYSAAGCGECQSGGECAKIDSISVDDGIINIEYSATSASPIPEMWLVRTSSHNDSSCDCSSGDQKESFGFTDCNNATSCTDTVQIDLRCGEKSAYNGQITFLAGAFQPVQTEAVTALPNDPGCETILNEILVEGEPDAGGLVYPNVSWDLDWGTKHIDGTPKELAILYQNDSGATITLESGIPLSGGGTSGSYTASTPIETTCWEAGEYKVWATVTYKAASCPNLSVDTKMHQSQEHLFEVTHEEKRMEILGKFVKKDSPVPFLDLLLTFDNVPVEGRELEIFWEWLDPPFFIVRRAEMGHGCVLGTSGIIQCEIPLVPPLGAPPFEDSLGVRVILKGCTDEPIATEYYKYSDLEGTCQDPGDPVQTQNGNSYLNELETLPGQNLFDWTRRFDSKEKSTGYFSNWSSMFDARVHLVANSNDVHISLNDQQYFIFGEESGVFSQIFPREDSDKNSLTFAGGRYALTLEEQGRIYEFNLIAGVYRLISIELIDKSRKVGIGWDGTVPIPTSVFDKTFFNWRVTVSPYKQIALIGTLSVDGTSIEYNYLYDNSGRLTAIEGSKKNDTVRSYEYSDTSEINENKITAVIDSLTNTRLSYSYDLEGNTNSVTSSKSSIIDLSYQPITQPDGTIFTDVTFSSGDTVRYWMEHIGGRFRTVGVDGSCPCGTNSARYAYDTEGRLARFQDGRGYISIYEYDEEDRPAVIKKGYMEANCVPDAKNECSLLSPIDLKNSISGGTILIPVDGEAFVRSFEYQDTQWPKRPTLIVETGVLDPNISKQTLITYNPATGLEGSRTILGVTDHLTVPNGTPTTIREIESRVFTNTYYDGTTALLDFADCNYFDVCDAYAGAVNWNLPQPANLLRSANGPRDDLNDVKDEIQFVYYPLNSGVPLPWQGRLAAIRDAVGNTTRYEDYDVWGNPNKIIDPNNVVKTRSFNNFNQKEEVRLLGDLSCDPITGPDPLCNIDLVKTNDYYPLGGPLRLVTGTSGSATQYGYDSFQRINTIERGESEGNYSERKVLLYDPVSGEVIEERIQKNLAVAINQGPGNPVGTGVGPTKTIPASPGPPSNSPGYYDYLLNAANWETTKITRRKFDHLGRLEKLIFADDPVDDGISSNNSYQQFFYDANNNIVAIADANHGNTNPEIGKTISDANLLVTYDSQNRLKKTEQLVDVSLTDPWATTDYTYDPQSNLRSVIDSNGNITEYQVDDFGQRLSTNSPVTGITLDFFDVSGNFTNTIDARGAHLKRSYDALNRITGEVVLNSILAQGTQVHTDLSITWIYNDTFDPSSNDHSVGRVRQIIDEVGTHTFEYDRRGLTRKKKTLYASGPSFKVIGHPNEYVMTQQYDMAGNPTVRSYPSGGTATTGYDWANRPQTLDYLAPGELVPQSIITGSTYAPFGPMETKTYGNGWSESRSYDQRYFLDSLIVTNGATEITNQNYLQDHVGNITDIDDLTAIDPSPIVGTGFSERHFDYDDAYRLKKAHAFDSAGNYALFGLLAFELDKVGNRLSKTEVDPVSLLPLKTSTYTYYSGPDSNNDSKLKSWEDGTATRIYDEYDLTGNPTANGAARYLYDDRGRLFQENNIVIGPGGGVILRHFYDYQGRRAAHFNGVHELNGSSGTQIGLVAFWWGDNIIEEAFPYVGQFFCPKGGCTIEKLVFDRLYFGGAPIAQASLSSQGSLFFRYLLSDHLGTTYAQGDENGVIEWRAEYRPFGQVEMVSGTNHGEDPAFRFPGQEQDDIFLVNSPGLPNLNYNVHRYYDPETGRYTQPDPIGLDAGPNLFTYTNGNPINLVDRLGLDVEYAGAVAKAADEIDQLMLEFIAEIGPETRTFTEGSGLVYLLKLSQGVNDARRLYLDSGCKPFQKAYSWKTSLSYAAGSANLAEQFTGSFGVTIAPSKSNPDVAVIFVNDKKGRESATRNPITRVPVLQDAPRSALGPMGDTIQKYRWMEYLPCNCNQPLTGN